MRWDLVESSLGDSPKESGSSLRTRREITRKKTVGLTTRLPEVIGICGMIGLPVPHNPSGGQQVSVSKPPKWPVNGPYHILRVADYGRRPVADGG
ncbi:hypothetical protein B296_00057917 [Ensete ventricosum]|uniref:Uncharacterized protein n=1 Tax=Ensete ventricosum TaxID=4639 RepID=A0A426WY14_ENSVE|nr:hypothetical protein B296_00057917 [Ensete ventricosum]